MINPKAILKRVDEFNDSLPSIYRHFNPNRYPNLGMFEHLARNWWLTLDHDRAAGDYDPIEDPDTLGWDAKQGLLMFGPPRAGKTMMACELSRRAMLNPANECKARFLGMVDWACEASNRGSKCELDGWARDIASSVWGEQAILILDDLDKLRVTDTVQSQLFNLIETATANEVSLIVTTNCTAAQLVKRFDKSFGEPIVSRLKEFCIPVNCAVQVATEQEVKA